MRKTATPPFVLSQPTATSETPQWLQLGAAALLSAGGPNGAAVLDGNGTASDLIVTSSRGAAARALSAWFGDEINVLGFGYNASGSPSENVTALNDAITSASAVPNGARIILPAGNVWNINANPNYTGNDIWELNGAVYSGGSTIVNNTGPDMFKTVLSGGEYWGRNQSNSGGNPLLRMDDAKTANTGTVANTFLLNASVSSGVTTTDYWPLSVILTGNADGGEHVGVASRAIKQSGTAEYWAFLGQSDDETGLASSSSGPLVGIEQDISAALADDGGAAIGLLPSGAGIRVGVDIVATSPNDTVAGNEFGFLVRAGAAIPPGGGGAGAWNQNVYAKRIFSAWGVYSVACFDTTMATPLAGSNAAAFVMSAGQTFGLDGAAATAQAAPVHDFTWNSAAEAFQLRKNQTAYFAVTDAGLVSGASVTVTPGGGLQGFIVNGSATHGLDVTGATLSSMAVHMKSGQKISFESTDTITMGLDGSNNVAFYNGTTENFKIAQSGNVTMLAGATLQIGSPYTAGTVTPTGYMEITDSSGTVRKVPCL